MSTAVLELLKEKGLAYSISGKDYLIKCLNPEHNDTSPSFRIDQTTGVAHCFSCGFKTNIFKHYGVLTNNVSIRIVKLKQKLKEVSESLNGLEPIKGAKPFINPFRGIRSSTLKTFEAFYTDSEEDLADRIVFPIYDINKKVTAYVGRHVLSNGNPRYVVYPKNSTISLYPVNVGKVKSIVLVEGIFDMLNLYDKGLHNVVCTFGTTKLHKDVSSKLLPYKVMGVEKIFILYDGDKPGKDSANIIKPLIEEAGFLVEIINLEEDTDPGDMSQEEVDQLIEYIK